MPSDKTLQALKTVELWVTMWAHEYAAEDHDDPDWLDFIKAGSLVLMSYKEADAMLEKLTKANAILRYRLSDIASDSAFQPALHAAAGIAEADAILKSDC